MFSKEEVTVCYTVEKCNNCNKEITRKFKEGDYLFSKTIKCQTCEGKLQIEKIFGETIEQ